MEMMETALAQAQSMLDNGGKLHTEFRVISNNIKEIDGAVSTLGEGLSELKTHYQNKNTLLESIAKQVEMVAEVYKLQNGDDERRLLIRETREAHYQLGMNGTSVKMTVNSVIRILQYGALIIHLKTLQKSSIKSPQMNQNNFH